MDIAQIQRANQMAKDLFSRGIATSMEEGMHIAENILSKASGEQVIPQATGPAGATPAYAQQAAPSPSQYFQAQPVPQPIVQNSSDVELQLRTLNFRLNEQASHIAQLQQKLHQMDAKLSAAHAMASARPQPRVISEPTPGGQTQLMQEAPQKVSVIINASTGESINVAEAGPENSD